MVVDLAQDTPQLSRLGRLSSVVLLTVGRAGRILVASSRAPEICATYCAGSCACS
jgi:hypothetical protein